MLHNHYNRRSTEDPGHSLWSGDRSTKSSRYSLVVQVPTLPNHDGLGPVLSCCAHVYEHKTLAFVQSGECINQTWPTDCFLNINQYRICYYIIWCQVQQPLSSLKTRG